MLEEYLETQQVSYCGQLCPLWQFSRRSCFNCSFQVGLPDTQRKDKARGEGFATTFFEVSVGKLQSHVSAFSAALQNCSSPFLASSITLPVLFLPGWCYPSPRTPSPAAGVPPTHRDPLALLWALAWCGTLHGFLEQTRIPTRSQHHQLREVTGKGNPLSDNAPLKCSQGLTHGS